MPDNSADYEVIDNSAERRFEASVDGALAFLTYRLRGRSALMLLHTEVPPAFEGRGIGASLVRAALEHARQAGFTVVPLCSFAAAYIARHPEYAELVHPDYRSGLSAP